MLTDGLLGQQHVTEVLTSLRQHLWIMDRKCSTGLLH